MVYSHYALSLVVGDRNQRNQGKFWYVQIQKAYHTPLRIGHTVDSVAFVSRIDIFESVLVIFGNKFFVFIVHFLGIHGRVCRATSELLHL